MPTTDPMPEPTTAPARLAAFLQCRDAEEYFAVLDLPFDPHVVAVNRLHILQMFAEELHRLSADGPAELLLAGYREALARCHQAFTTGGALDHRLFRVLRECAPAGCTEPHHPMVPDGSTNPIGVVNRTETAEPTAVQEPAELRTPVLRSGFVPLAAVTVES